MPKNNKANHLLKLIKPYLLGLIKGLTVFIVFYSVIAFLMYKTNFDNQYIYYLIYIFIILGGFICAISVYKKVRGRGFLTGIISSIPYSLSVFLIICAINNFNISSDILLIFILTLSGGFLGGITAANVKI